MARTEAFLRAPSGATLREKIDAVTVREGDCLIYKGAIRYDGKAALVHAGKNVDIQRWLLEQKLGRPILPGHSVKTSCQQRRCCEKDHLVEYKRAPRTATLATSGEPEPVETVEVKVNLKELIDSLITVDPESGCWLWQGEMSGGKPYVAYGKQMINVRRRIIQSHEGPERVFLGMSCGKDTCVRAECMRVDPPFDAASAQPVIMGPPKPVLDTSLCVYVATNYLQFFRKLIARRACRGMDCGEILGDMLLRLTRIDTPLAEIRDPKAYAVRVALNLIFEMRKRDSLNAARLREAATEWNQHSSTRFEDDIASDLQSEALINAVDSVLSRIKNKKYGHVVWGAVIDQKKYSELAKELKISEGMVKKYLTGGLRKLRQHFGAPLNIDTRTKRPLPRRRAA